MVITVNDPKLKNLSGEEIALLAAACVDVFDSVEMKDIKDLFLFDMQNIIIKYDLIDKYFGDNESISFMFTLMKDLLNTIEKVENIKKLREENTFIDSVKAVK